jgi:membrane protease subunit HflC
VRKIGLYLLALVVAVFLLAYTMTYTIRFTEAGVKTRFGSAAEGSVKRDPGLYFKWPLIDAVTTYDTRPRVTQVRLETQQTKDGRQIIVEAFSVWRVSDPLAFFQRFSNAGSAEAEHFRSADETVKSNLRNALGAVSQYDLSRLLNADPAVDGLGELERDVLNNLTLTAPSPESPTSTPSAATFASLGIDYIDVGISQIVLPQETTTKVFERMSQTQETKAKSITAAAEANANTIRSRADQDAKRIESFANQLAAEIRAKGDKEAEKYYALQQKNPQLAQFLIEVQMLKEVYGRKGTTLVLPWSMPVLRWLNPTEADRAIRAGSLGDPADMSTPGSAAVKPASGGSK